MGWILTKYLATAAVVVVVSEVAKRSDKAGALIASLPLVTILALVWMYVEQQPTEKLANHAKYTFWYVLPTLPMFLLFPYLLGRLGFWGALATGAAVTVACFAALAIVLGSFGLDLL